MTFFVDDCELSWLDTDVDLVHFRFMAIVLKNMPTVLAHAFAALRPGGFVELHELNGVPRCDDGTMSDADHVLSLYKLAGRAWSRFGMDVLLAEKLGPLLTAAGFEDVRSVVRKVPIGPWPRDKKLRVIGAYQKVAVEELIQSLAGRPFEALGLSHEESNMRLALARSALNDGSVHRYFDYYFWYARKPLGCAGEGVV